MEKRRVHVLTTYNSPNSSALVHPLLVNKHFFEERGIGFYFFGNIEDRIYNCDAIFLNSKYFRTWHGSKERELYDALSLLKKRIERVIWFDTTDSTGTTQFNVMPFVDAYYKNQVLKDRSLYAKPFYGHRIFTDFYKRTFGIGDEALDTSCGLPRGKALTTPLKKPHEEKLRVSWNSGMNNWGAHALLCGAFLTRLKSSLPFGADYTTRFIKAERDRRRDISARIGIAHSRSAIRYQRENVGRLLERFGVDLSFLPRRRYFNEMRNSKVGVSPFGWGEICYRDFEIIINGALLFKADMSHLETWPPLYAANETYIPFSWDFEDFEEKLEALLKNGERIVQISRKAQELYAHFLYGDGRREFCERVIEIIGH